MSLTSPAQNLRHDLDRLLQPIATETGWTASFRIPASFSGFAGHFPENPIVPAVTQILALRCLLEKGLGLRLRLKSIRQAKFTRPILPEMQVTALVQRDAKVPFRWRGQLTTENGQAALVQFEENRDDA